MRGDDRGRAWRGARRSRGTDPIIATMLLGGITVTLAAVLYILIVGLVHGPGATPIGTAVALGTPTLANGGTGSTFPTCAAGDYCYAIALSPSNGLAPGGLQLQVRNSSGAVWTGLAGGGGAAIADLDGHTVASAGVAAGTAFVVTTWTFGTGYAATTPLSSSMTLWLDMGTGNPAVQGYTLVVLGTGGYSGQVAVALP